MTFTQLDFYFKMLENGVAIIPVEFEESRKIISIYRNNESEIIKVEKECDEDFYKEMIKLLYLFKKGVKDIPLKIVQEKEEK